MTNKEDSRIEDNKPTSETNEGSGTNGGDTRTEDTSSEFSWGAPPSGKRASPSGFDYGFDRFPAPRTDDNGKTQWANKLYTQTYKAVANAMARYIASFPEGTKEEDLPQFQKSVVKGPDKKPVGVRVWRTK